MVQKSIHRVVCLLRFPGILLGTSSIMCVLFVCPPKYVVLAQLGTLRSVAVWFGFVSYTKALYDNGTAVFSMVITLSVIFSTDVLKALFAERISWLIEPQKLKNIFRVFGALMICFSIRLLLHPFL